MPADLKTVNSLFVFLVHNWTFAFKELLQKKLMDCVYLTVV